jgi:hypothetical protein
MSKLQAWHEVPGRLARSARVSTTQKSRPVGYGVIRSCALRFDDGFVAFFVLIARAVPEPPSTNAAPKTLGALRVLRARMFFPTIHTGIAPFSRSVLRSIFPVGP